MSAMSLRLSPHQGQLRTSISNVRPGGLGLRWMRHHAVDWRYTREGGRNVVALRVLR
jgi:hypothetical protein